MSKESDRDSVASHCSSSAGGKGGCWLGFVKSPHDRKCDACEMHSATLYSLQVGQLKFRICCFCKSSIGSGIERVDGPDDCY
jgi:hypothetical protein